MEAGNWVFINENDFIPADLLSVPKRYEEYVDPVVISFGMIQDRILRLAEDLIEEYNGRELLILVVLKGAFRFAKDLIDYIDKKGSGLRYQVEFIRVKSYENEFQGEVKVESFEKLKVNGKNVLVIEDLVDSGSTLVYVKNEVLDGEPLSLKIAALVFKRNPVNVKIVPDVIGFSIPNVWIVGFGMDYNQIFRDLGHIAVLNSKGKARFRH